MDQDRIACVVSKTFRKRLEQEAKWEGLTLSKLMRRKLAQPTINRWEPFIDAFLKTYCEKLGLTKDEVAARIVIDFMAKISAKERVGNDTPSLIPAFFYTSAGLLSSKELHGTLEVFYSRMYRDEINDRTISEQNIDERYQEGIDTGLIPSNYEGSRIIAVEWMDKYNAGSITKRELNRRFNRFVNIQYAATLKRRKGETDASY